MATQQKKNKTTRLDESQEQMRQTVIEQELSARSWKAYYEKMYFSIESEKLEPEYEEYKKRIAKKMDEFKAEQADMMKKLEDAMKEAQEKPAENEELKAHNVSTHIEEIV